MHQICDLPEKVVSDNRSTSIYAKMLIINFYWENIDHINRGKTFVIILWHGWAGVNIFGLGCGMPNIVQLY